MLFYQEPDRAMEELFPEHTEISFRVLLQPIIGVWHLRVEEQQRIALDIDTFIAVMKGILSLEQHDFIEVPSHEGWRCCTGDHPFLDIEHIEAPKVVVICFRHNIKLVQIELFEAFGPK